MGSPMPMKTMLEGEGTRDWALGTGGETQDNVAVKLALSCRLSPSAQCPVPSAFFPTTCFAKYHCPTISAALKLRTNPICAVSQKVQPMAQPTWLLTHKVYLVLPVEPRIGISTLSISRCSSCWLKAALEGASMVACSPTPTVVVRSMRLRNLMTSPSGLCSRSSRTMVGSLIPKSSNASAAPTGPSRNTARYKSKAPLVLPCRRKITCPAAALTNSSAVTPKGLGKSTSELRRVGRAMGDVIIEETSFVTCHRPAALGGSVPNVKGSAFGIRGKRGRLQRGSPGLRQHECRPDSSVIQHSRRVIRHNSHVC